MQSAACQNHWAVNVDFRSVKVADDVTFKEFLRFVLLQSRQGDIEPHWKPQYNICHPCHVNYDFIGHHETLDQDADHVLRQISGRRRARNTTFQFPATHLDSRNRKSGELLREFYGNVSSHILFRLLRLYVRDYELFGYEIPDVIRRRLNLHSSTYNVLKTIKT